MARNKKSPKKNTTAPPEKAPVAHNSTIRKRRRKNLWLREIKKLQKTTNLLIPKAAFCRVVKETLQKIGANDMRFTATAIEALHEAVEIYMTQFFEDAYLCTAHRRRVTLMPIDIHLCRRLRGLGDVINSF
ncbi:histone H3.3-like [Ctenocephalides felis]|uniref:histone H3.3-like n=1 Tax=Ctenocephalides felis TaxID=7515 RepID=UPI000E6E1DA3|nr:histone H3.3-like [Ctenocephalides felis]